MAEKVYSDPQAAALAAERLPRWTVRDGWLCRTFRVHGWKSAVLLTGMVAHLAEAAWHHPEVIVTFGFVSVRLRTHSARAITSKDFALASKIEEIVGWRGEGEGNSDGTPADPRRAYLAEES